MFFLEAVICTSLCLLLGLEVSFVLNVTRCIVVLFHTRIRADLFCETRLFLRLYVFVELSVVIWNDVSVVGCRQSNCSYNAESL